MHHVPRVLHDERLELVAGGDEGLDGVEYGSGFFVQRTISLLVGT